MAVNENECTMREDIMSGRTVFALGGSLVVSLIMWAAALLLLV